jgi:hypothetical protein
MLLGGFPAVIFGSHRAGTPGTDDVLDTFDRPGHEVPDGAAGSRGDAIGGINRALSGVRREAPHVASDLLRRTDGTADRTDGDGPDLRPDIAGAVERSHDSIAHKVHDSGGNTGCVRPRGRPWLR